MAVNFAFYNAFRTTEAGKAKYDALSKDEKESFHQHLPLLLIGAGVSKITETTLPVIVSRLYLLRIFPSLDEKGIETWLTPFIGITSNVTDESTTQWVKRHQHIFLDYTAAMQKKAAKELVQLCATT